MKVLSQYDRQASGFLRTTGATIEKKYLKTGKHFADDTQDRDIYSIIIRRGNDAMQFDFGQSIQSTQERAEAMRKAMPFYPQAFAPSNYDILACLQKTDPGTLHDFCLDYGYDEDSKKAEKIYDAVVKEYKGLCRLFSDKELEAMQEIV